jgi:hypothetical protein
MDSDIFSFQRKREVMGTSYNPLVKLKVEGIEKEYVMEKLRRDACQNILITHYRQIWENWYSGLSLPY